MKAARYHGQRDLRVEDVDVPQIANGQALIQIEWCGICGSDLHEYLVGPAVIPRKEAPHPLTGAVLPVTMGHEFCGRVSKVGPNSKLRIGEPVMVDPRFFCSSCHSCNVGDTNICNSWGFLGLQSNDGGGYSEYVAVKEDMCYVLPDSVPLSEAALIEPLTVARHATKKSGFDDYRDKTVLVLGGGPVGLALIFVLKASGVGKLIVSEPTAKRQEQAAKFVDVVLNPREVNVPDKCRELTDGKGVDIVFDCAGIMPGLKDGMDALRRGGTYVNVAGWERECIVPMGHFMLKEIVFRASMSYTEEDFKQTVDEFVAGKFKGFEKLVTARIALDDVVAKGFEELVNNKDDHVKIMVTPRKELLVQS
ncbi:chlorophyll synthesis pathway protein BchC [Fonsecaea erecta]|uniref:Chlorophyll synthesis pathway protein BchC n=1 Tax=Fonsecaea erecta TaxID=1367422 RepID=A0A178ZZA6_9EURO|nr:chlorophyll synthesis pathway protein BchC [Fonsecaea erecta]OAP65067.1 chlorophyll synthesis pathway protein BchC [Fonsecaea erecta]